MASVAKQTKESKLPFSIVKANEEEEEKEDEMNDAEDTNNRFLVEESQLPPMDLSNLGESDIVARMCPAAVFKQIFESIKDLIDDANFMCSERGISLQAMDSSHVSLVALFLYAAAFEPYHVRRERSLGLSIISLCKIFTCASKDDIITLQTNAESDDINWSFQNPSQIRKVEFTLKLMDIDTDQLGIPDEEYECMVRMPVRLFQQTCKEIKIVTDTVKITVTDESIAFGGTGDIGVGKIIHKRNEVNNLNEDNDSELLIQLKKNDNNDMKTEFSQTFALSYLTRFSKACSYKMLGKFVILKLSANRPIVVEYLLESTRGHLRFYLAPKIEENEQLE